MSLLPGIHKRELKRRRFLVNDNPQVRGPDVVIDKAAKSPVPPHFQIVPGTVIVRKQGEKRFVVAGDPTGERNTPAAVPALQPADTSWAGSTITASHAAGLGVSVVLNQGVDDNAKVIDQLNRNRTFASRYLADENQHGRVRIRTWQAGADHYLHVRSSLNAAFGPDGTAGSGRDADYRVTLERIGELEDLERNPIEAWVPSLLVGHFLEQELLNLTPEARVVFVRRGSLFKND